MYSVYVTCDLMQLVTDSDADRSFYGSPVLTLESRKMILVVNIIISVDPFVYKYFLQF